MLRFTEAVPQPLKRVMLRFAEASDCGLQRTLMTPLPPCLRRGGKGGWHHSISPFKTPNGVKTLFKYKPVANVPVLIPALGLFFNRAVNGKLFLSA